MCCQPSQEVIWEERAIGRPSAAGSSSPKTTEINHERWQHGDHRWSQREQFGWTGGGESLLERANKEWEESTQESFNKWVDKQSVMLLYNGVLFHPKKEGSADTCSNIDESSKHCNDWKKPVTSGHMLYDSSYLKYPVWTIYRDRKHISGYQRLGESGGSRGKGSDCFMGPRFAFEMMKSFGTRPVTATPHCEHTLCHWIIQFHMATVVHLCVFYHNKKNEENAEVRLQTAQMETVL